MYATAKIRRDPRLRNALQHNPQTYTRVQQDPEATVQHLVRILKYWEDSDIADGGLDKAFLGLLPLDPVVRLTSPHMTNGSSATPAEPSRHRPAEETPLAKRHKSISEGNSPPLIPSPIAAAPLSNELLEHMNRHIANSQNPAATTAMFHQLLAAKQLPQQSPLGTGPVVQNMGAQTSIPQSDDRAEHERSLRNKSAQKIIRDCFDEFIKEKRTNKAPRWGGRLVAALTNPRAPFGVGVASDSLDSALKDFQKEAPNLLQAIIKGDGQWPAADHAWANDLIHMGFATWTRRLVRPLLIALVDSWRRELSTLNDEARPSAWLAEDLDKELRKMKDIDGEWLIGPYWKDGKKRAKT